MKIKISLTLTFCTLFIFSCSNDLTNTNNNSILWYTYPARFWNSQALHLGNGYFGASFFGGVNEEVLSLSEKSMWTGGPANGDWQKAGINPKAMETLPLIRRAITMGKSQYADSLITNNFFGSSEKFGNFTSIGDLRIHFLNHDSLPERYMRSLDLGNSLGSIQYTMNKTQFKREYFCSYPQRVLVMNFTADKKGQISFDMGLDIMQDSSYIEFTDNTYRVKGFINGNKKPFQVLIHFRKKGGTLSHSSDHMIVRNADEVELCLTITTNYKMKYPDYTGDDPGNIADDIMQKALKNDYAELRNLHITDYRSLYDRVSFTVNGDNDLERLPTNERFEKLKAGGSDPGYKVLTFNLGRYMIISSSRPGTLPANLQGVWNAFRVAPWAGNYQSNINLQEIYWSCGPTNLAECQQPYIDWIGDLAISGREIAGRIYGTHGWVSHTTGNIWGHASPIGDHPWGMYPMGAAWHCQHVWDQYEFTQDRKYLEEQAYPLLKDASIFWLENLIPYRNYLITAPTVSAEHGALMTESGLNPAFHDSISNKYNYSIPGVYQDIEMVWDLFTNTATAARKLGEIEFADSLLNVRSRLMPLKIGKYGQLQEWFEDIDNPECHHRHIAHMYAVCPGNQINPFTTPQLAAAAKISLNMRGDGRYPDQELASGGNWARAHRMWCWTRLLDGNRANKILTGLLTEQGFENGLTHQHAEYHWNRKDFYMEDSLYLHFQLDASASIPGVIAEMVVQSHEGEIHLLPALPDEFTTGKILGVKTRGGYTVDLEWKNGELLWAKIHANKTEPPPIIRYNGRIIETRDLSLFNIRFVNSV
jgi:alpha-L-fucosidase 2